ncbi:MAG: hypothetical protein IPJ76_13045 [Flavobacteriales bacterium]|nr:MAG: hypothetical protein IPJ76_13045 [Flavobacteriales bacterium]
MRRPVLLAVLLFIVGVAKAQPYGNEWIDFGKQYWKVGVVVPGFGLESIFRIDSTALAQSGFPVGEDPHRFQLWGRGQEWPIFIQGEADSVFNIGDFIEFYTEDNNGWNEAEHWENPAYQNGTSMSLYEDSIFYFLTLADPGQSPLRIHSYQNTDFGGLALRTWAFGESVVMNTNGYVKGERDGWSGASTGFMGSGEGWLYSHINDVSNNTAAAFDMNFPAPGWNYYNGPGAPDAQLTTKVFGGSENCSFYPTHNVQLLFGPTGSQTVVMHDTLGPWETRPVDITIPNALLQPGSKVTLNSLDGLNLNCVPQNPTFISTITDVRLEFPRTMDMLGSGYFKLWFPDDSQENDANVAFTNVGGNPVFHVINTDSVFRVVPTWNGAAWQARFPANSAGDRSLVVSVPFPIGITGIKPVSATGYFPDLVANQLDSACIIVTHKSLLGAAQQYATMRESSPRNPMPTMVVDVEDLYLQYGGGVPKSAMAIRKFAKHLLDAWSTDPQALFLIGKSVVGPTIGTDGGSRRPNPPSAYTRNLVPTFGYPPCDVCFTMGLNGDPKQMAIPVGRLSAETEQEVLDYMGKMQAFESDAEPEEWMKNILHFRGGFTQAEWQLFDYYLSSWENIVEDSLLFSGEVTNFRKNTGNLFDQASADSVRTFIEDKGVTMMTFLAHASGQGFDINIDQPGGYQWKEHPLILGNSCYSGNIHLNYQGGAGSASENYVIAGDAGAIGFIASVDIGTTNYLGPYTNYFYRSFCYANYGKSVGQHMKYAIFEQLSDFTSISNTHNTHTMTLHGDPAMALPSWPKPEFTIADADIRIIPEQVTAELDTFVVQAVVENIGRGYGEPVVVRMDRTLPGGGLESYQVQLDSLLLRDTVEFKVPLLDDQLGSNTFTVMIDLQPDEIPEQWQEDLNNMAFATTNIISAELLPIWPYNFAITPDASPVLKASTSDPFAPSAAYVFRIDTTDLFNSPVMEQGTVTAPGGVITWQPPSIFNLNNSIDSLVFFWRCSPDSVDATGYKWRESSFQHIPNREGWGQAHYFQFKNDNYNNVVYDRPNREFDFFTGNHELRVNVLGNSVGAGNAVNEWYIDLEVQEGGGCQNGPAFVVGVVDPGTFTAWRSGPRVGPGYYGNFNWVNSPTHFGCRPRSEKYFMFKQNLAPSLDSLRAMLEDSIPVGHYFVLYTWKNLNRSATDVGLGAGFYDYMVSLGADSIRSCPDFVPYLFITRKGYPGATEVWGQTSTDFISGTFFCTVEGNQGLMTGPPTMQFTEYEAFYWDEKPLNVNDTTTMKLWKRDASGAETLVQDLASPLDSLNGLDSIVDAEQYPELRVGAFLTDYQWPDAVPAQMKRWQIIGEPAPECAIDPPLGYFVNVDSLYEGQNGRVAVAVHNISNYAMDSLLLAAWIVDEANNRRGIHYKRNPPLPVGGVIMDTISVSTEDLGGGNFLFIEANPVDSATGVYDQPEQYHFNNYASLRFTIQEDLENPLLDVTFDGVHILDGDIVSAKPEIQMTLDDENTTLIMDSPADTALFKVFLADPSGTLKRIYFVEGGQEVMQFVPAENGKNIAKILYRPALIADGKYSLQVQASDVSGNASGDNTYKISFEVMNKPSITSVLNYPNPFTTSTRFVFTVTGSEPPTQMRIQIMTVSGRVVRTVDAAELGPMHVGRNITEFAWDGTDEFGDRLARGVYLYRVDARLNGQDIEHRDSGADPWIEKGMGKMYLLR